MAVYYPLSGLNAWNYTDGERARMLEVIQEVITAPAKTPHIIAAEVRAKNPSMQVKRLDQP